MKDTNLPNAEETKRILKARAQALAREPAKAQAADALEIVEFVLAHERYGVETCWVREVHSLTNLTPLPCTPAFVLGVVNLRGEIVSVIDVRKFFELPEKGLTDLTKVVVLQSSWMRFGILVDAVLGVRNVPVGEIQPSLPTLTGIREQYLKGVSSERTIILDAEKLLRDEKIVVHEQIER
jgi:purine-binding chemotaxis protein CheW